MHSPKYLFVLCLICFVLLIIYTTDCKYENIHDSIELNQQYTESDLDSSLVSENTIEYNFDYEKLKSKFNISDRYLFGTPFVASDYGFKHVFGNLSDFKWNSRANDENAISTDKVNCGDIIYIKIDYVDNFFKIYHPNIKHPYILITHEGDFSAGSPEHLNYLNDPKIIIWFAENVVGRHPKLKPLPIGVVAPRGEDFETLIIFAQQPLPYYSRKYLLYLNFSPTTNKNRKTIKGYFKDTYENNSRIFIIENQISWKNYLINVGNSEFVISPPGNGIDCLRTWEALAMGAVPIVMKSELMPLYENMPVMVVNNWTEVTEENLRKFQKEKLQNFSSGGLPWRPKLWLRYWINEIMSVKQIYVQNNC